MKADGRVLSANMRSPILSPAKRPPPAAAGAPVATTVEDVASALTSAKQPGTGTQSLKRPAPGDVATQFVVMKRVYPSGFGCYSGSRMSKTEIERLTETKTIGSFASMAEACDAAQEARDRDCRFADWSEEHYETAPPPYCSADGENYDEDEHVLIYVVTPAEQAAEQQRLAKKLQAASVQQPLKKLKRTFAFQFGEDPGCEDPTNDAKIFARNPCRVKGGNRCAPDMYPGKTGKTGYLAMMQRQSNRNYAMREFCLGDTDDGDVGARFKSFKLPRYVSRIVAWYVFDDLDVVGQDPSVTDTLHADLADPKTGKCLLTRSNLLAAVSASTRCIFLNSHQTCARTGFVAHETAAAEAIRTAAPSLECLSINESTLTGGALDELAKCRNLRGILLSNNCNDATATDAALAAVLRASSQLRWLYVDSQYERVALFGDQCWNALQDGCCPLLQVLWIDFTSAEQEARLSKARRVLAKGTPVRTRLDLCMICPKEGPGRTKKLQSQV